MADLQVCYFCGAGPDSSLGEYAVVPPALDPDEDQQASVVLCPDCREKLMTVMDPVVEAAEAHAGGATGPPTGGSDDAGQGSAGSVGEPAPDSPDPGPAAADDPLADPSPSADDGGASAGGGSPLEDPDESATRRSPGEDATPGDSGGDTASADEGATRPDDDQSSDGSDHPRSGPPRDQPHADDELVGRNNEAYNKTLRLLQNREFPVERHEIEQVAANAYQLDPQEVSDAIDALIRKGLLTQEGAQLVRP